VCLIKHCRSPQPLRSPRYRFPSLNYNYFRYPSAILEIWAKEASGDVGIPVYTSEKVLQNIGIAIEIASISVPVVKLLVLPVWFGVLFLLPICT